MYTLGKQYLQTYKQTYKQKIDRTIANIKERGYDYSSQYARMAMQNFSRTLMEAVFRVCGVYSISLFKGLDFPFISQSII